MTARESTPLLTPGTLARFGGAGLTWREIVGADGPSRGWWRRAVQQAETDGLLEWSRERLAWSLTDAGREAVKEVA